jgi:hypothetical protein
MEFVKLLLSQNYKGYSYIDASDIKMSILGLFLTDDVGCSSSPFKELAFNDNWGDACSGNITGLEKDGNYILLTDLYSNEETPSALKMTRQQYIQVITDWEEKVCKLKPKEVIIKHENDQFIIETKD